MTKKELSNLYYISKEIKTLERRLSELKQQGEIQSPAITGMPVGSNVSDPVQRMAVERTALVELLEDAKARAVKSERETMEYIQSVDDTMIRLILYYRHVELLRWWQVADKIGGGNTSASVRKMHQRFCNNLSHMSQQDMLL